MWLIVLGFMFPTIELVSIATTYACCFVLNSMQADQAALTSQSRMDQNMISEQMPQTWAQSGMGQFAKVQGQPTTQITFTNAAPDPAGNAPGPSGMVTVSTTFTVLPLFEVPMLGLGATSFSITSTRIVEDPDGAN